MGAGTFSEEGGQERNRPGSHNFSYFVPATFEFAQPEFSVLGGQQWEYCWPPKSLNVKGELFNYILQKIQGG